MIRLDGVEKVYRTDRIETVALAERQPRRRRRASSSRSWGPRAAARARCSTSSACSTRRRSGTRRARRRRPSRRYGDARWPRMRNREIGFVFQTFHLIPDLSVARQRRDPAALSPHVGRASAAGWREAALERVGLASRVHHFPSQLSGGQQQRVAIARAIVGRPRDPARRRADRQPRQPDGRRDHGASSRTCNRATGRPIVMVTHDPRQAEQTERIVRLFDGRQVRTEAAPC